MLKATEPWEEQTGSVPYNCDYNQRLPMGNGWSNSNNTPTWFQCGWPQGPRAVGYAGTFQGAFIYSWSSAIICSKNSEIYERASQGAVAYDEQLKLFRMWYSCGNYTRNPPLPVLACGELIFPDKLLVLAGMPAENADDPLQGLCHAESHDGRDWVKRLVGTGNNTGTNKVYTEAFDSAIVWQDYVTSQAINTIAFLFEIDCL